MRALQPAVLMFCLWAIACASTEAPGPAMSQAANIALPSADASTCVAPAAAVTLRTATNTGCKSSLEGCVVGTPGYGLVCFAPIGPQAALNCSVTPTPTNNAGYVSYCCPCSP